MGTSDKIRHEMDDVKGKVKEGVGRMTDKPDMEAEGKMDQTKAEMGKAAEDVKDAVTGD